ncbi:MAG: hypothetical protein ACOC0P_00755 [Planctomycetota bacterium]
MRSKMNAPGCSATNTVNVSAPLNHHASPPVTAARPQWIYTTFPFHPGLLVDVDRDEDAVREPARAPLGDSDKSTARAVMTSTLLNSEIIGIASGERG